MAETWTPKDAAEVADAVGQALADRRTLELVGASTRRALGRPVAADVVLDLSALSGIVAYQPEELVLTAGPGAPLAEIEAMLAARGQALAFEPPDFGPLWGKAAGQGTLGGCVMIGLGGPRRLSAGAPRDHCLGVKGVNGFGEAFGAGGRVVKNVTGFDISKLVAGSFGTLCAVTELTLKVLPAAPDVETLALVGLDDGAAVSAMSRAMGSPVQVSAAAHLPAEVADGGEALTLLRIEGFRPSVTARIGHLAETFKDLAPQRLFDSEASVASWKAIAAAAPFAAVEGVVWKLSVPPSHGAAVGERLARDLGGRVFYDWAGGAVWLQAPDGPGAHAPHVRTVLDEEASGHGHATLIRAPEAVRAAVPPFQPLAPAVAALGARVKAQFDPEGLFNPGRMYA